MQPTASRWLALLLASLCALGCVEEAISGPSRPARSPANVRFAPSERAPTPAGSGCSAKELSQVAQRVLRGKSTYYANSLTGYRTANGERYDPRRLTAAHRSLPFGTRIRVTRTDRPDSP